MSYKKKQTDQLDFTEIKCCASKDTMKKAKRKLTEEEKIFANHV